MKYQIRPLSPWPGPVTASRKSSGVFQADWDSTLILLRDEVGKLDGEYPIIIQIDVGELDLRQDGMLRTRASVGPFPGVIVSFRSRFGPLQYASDAYEQRYTGSLPGWQANVRAVALALEALRAVDRYGVSKRGEQYTGWRAIEAGNGHAFASADAAERWMCERSRDLGLPVATNIPQLYRQLARKMHPDTGADAAEWNRLDSARQLLTAGSAARSAAANAAASAGAAPTTAAARTGTASPPTAPVRPSC
jgi:hypothetical protein